MIEVKTTGDGLLVKVYVQPKSSRNQMAGAYRGALKLKIAAPPVDGAANKACVRFLAKRLGMARSRLDIVSGRTSRMKLILIRAKGSEKSALGKKIVSWGAE
jgi:uncharacterized protein (TIGR00251 family)